MTEERINEILLKKQYDYPKLHSEAAETIANCYTDIIYDTLKLKSSAPTNKRLNFLKYLKNLACNRDNHCSIDEENYLKLINSFKAGYTSDENLDDLTKVLKQINKELEEQIPQTLCEEVQNFYKRKNKKVSDKIMKVESIKNYDQEALDKANFPSKVTRKIYYETGDNIIKQLFNNDSQKTILNNLNIVNIDFTNLEYREKQIKYAYALIHFCDWGNLEHVLKKLTKYDKLTKLEINFLLYLNESTAEESEFLRQYLVENFIFIYENFITETCTRIVKLQSEEVQNFLENLLCDKNFIIIKQLSVDPAFKLTLKNMLYELYRHNTCNDNILKFMDFLL